MVCTKCQEMLYYHEGRIGRGLALELKFVHHDRDEALQGSAMEGCYLCRAIWSKIRGYDAKLLNDTEVADDQVRFLTATLKCVRRRREQVPQLHQIDFRIKGKTDVIASFVLEEIIKDPHQKGKKNGEDQKSVKPAQSANVLSPESRGSDSVVDSHQKSSETPKDGEIQQDQKPLQPPRSGSTESRDVIDLAKKWIEECANEEGGHARCRPTSDTPCYPDRLLDLREMIEYKQYLQEQEKEYEDPPTQQKLRRSNTYAEELFGKAQQLALRKSTLKIHLVSRRESELRYGMPTLEGRYVTLSHCWGKADFKKLMRSNIQQWLSGMPVADLPKTFQDAIDFACELDKVRYIWIDALCIIQKDEQDWMTQSALMHEIYTHSYCNISATAASDSTKGLFYNRDPSTSWFDIVSLKLEDDLNGKAGGHIDCTILDLSFWEETVDQAPVNKRSWVFQERLLAPRVIHWCKDQIAFECREVDKAECLPAGLPHYQGKTNNIIEESKLKCIDLETGKRLRELKEEPHNAELSGKDEIFYLYEIWKRLVETYSKMDIGHHRDRVIALSGIGKMMTSVLESHGKDERWSDYFPSGSKDQFIAGMWRNYMASQLLWHVNEGIGPARQPFDDTRPRDHEDPKKHIYRAPSFSWASVETPRGVTFAETTDTGLLIRVEVIRLTYQEQVDGSGSPVGRPADDEFGLLTDGYLVIRGILRKIELIDVEASWRASILSPKWLKRILTASGVGCVPILVSLATCAVFQLRRPLAAIISWAALCGVLSLLVILLHVVFRWEDAARKPSGKFREHQGNNRYRWCLVKGGERDQDVKTKAVKTMQELWLDSPASPPSIFDRRSHVYCVPAAKDSEGLTCLLLQAVLGGDYGVRYKRIGLAKVSTMFGDVEDIVKPPGLADTKLGKYYYGPDGQKDGESTICII